MCTIGFIVVIHVRFGPHVNISEDCFARSCHIFVHQQIVGGLAKGVADLVFELRAIATVPESKNM